MLSTSLSSSPRVPIKLAAHPVDTTDPEIEKRPPTASARHLLQERVHTRYAAHKVAGASQPAPGASQPKVQGSRAARFFADLKFPDVATAGVYGVGGLPLEARPLASAIDAGSDAGGILSLVGASVLFYDSIRKEGIYDRSKLAYLKAGSKVEAAWGELEEAAKDLANVTDKSGFEKVKLQMDKARFQLAMANLEMVPYEACYFSKAKREQLQEERGRIGALAEKYSACAASGTCVTRKDFDDDALLARPKHLLTDKALATRTADAKSALRNATTVQEIQSARQELDALSKLNGESKGERPGIALEARRLEAIANLLDARTPQERLEAQAQLKSINHLVEHLGDDLSNFDPSEWSRAQLVRVRDTMLQPSRAALESVGATLNLVGHSTLAAAGAAAVASIVFSIAAAPFMFAMGAADYREAGFGLPAAANAKSAVFDLIDKLEVAAQSRPFGEATDGVFGALYQMAAGRLDAGDRAEFLERLRKVRGEGAMGAAAVAVGVGGAILGGALAVAVPPLAPVLVAPVAAFVTAAGVDFGLKKKSSIDTYEQERAARMISGAVGMEGLERLFLDAAKGDGDRENAMLDAIVKAQAGRLPKSALMLHEKVRRRFDPKGLEASIAKALRPAEILSNPYLALDYLTFKLQEAAYAPDSGSDELMPIEQALVKLGMTEDQVRALVAQAATSPPSEHFTAARTQIAALLGIRRHISLDLPTKDAAATSLLVQAHESFGLLEFRLRGKLDGTPGKMRELVERIEKFKLLLLEESGVTDADLRTLAEALAADEPAEGEPAKFGMLTLPLLELLLNPRLILTPGDVVGAAASQPVLPAKQPALKFSGVRNAFKDAAKSTTKPGFVARHFHLRPSLSAATLQKQPLVAYEMLQTLYQQLLKSGAVQPLQDGEDPGKYYQDVRMVLRDQLERLQDRVGNVLGDKRPMSNMATKRSMSPPQKLWLVIEELKAYASSANWKPVATAAAAA